MTEEDVQRISEQVDLDSVKNVGELQSRLLDLGFSPKSLWAFESIFSDDILLNAAIEEAKEDELIKSAYEEKYGREPAPAYVEEAEKFMREEGRPPTDAEMEERRRLKEMQESAHMKEGEEAGIIRRVGKQVVDFVKDRVIGWIRKRLSPSEEVQEAVEQPTEAQESSDEQS